MFKISTLVILILFLNSALATEVNLIEKAELFKRLSLQAHARSANLARVFLESRIIGDYLAVPLHAQTSLQEANINGIACPQKDPQAKAFLCLNKMEVGRMEKWISDNSSLSLAYNNTYLKALAAANSPEGRAALQAELEREKAYLQSFKQKHDELKSQLEAKYRNKQALEQSGPFPVRQYKKAFGRTAFMDFTDEGVKSFVEGFLIAPPFSSVIMFFIGVVGIAIFGTIDVLIAAYGGIFWIISQFFFQGSYYTPIKQAETEIIQLTEKVRNFPKLEMLENQIIMKSEFLSLAEREALRKTQTPALTSLP